MFKLSERSLSRLKGVHADLSKAVQIAITTTPIDFGVTQGLRTIEEQKELVARGASQTMKSKHLEGKAVDLVCYVAGKVCWETNVYDDVAEEIRKAARDCGAKIRWGAAWHIPDICAYEGTMEDAMMEYIDLRRSQGRRPFIDAPHFEVSDG